MESTTSYDVHFLADTVAHINAAAVGISRNRWSSIKAEEATEREALARMQAGSFDVLPITTEVAVKEYFQTDKWNDFTSVSRKSITHRDVIPLHTHIRDVIKGFASESRLFYFLRGHLTIHMLNTAYQRHSRI